MNPVVKDELLEALESGRYKKGCRQLYNKEENSYCCLGVLTDLYNKAHPQEQINFSDLKFLPVDVADWAGIKEENRAMQRVNGYFVCDLIVNISGKYLDHIGMSPRISAVNDRGPNALIDFSDVIPLIREQL